MAERSAAGLFIKTLPAFAAHGTWGQLVGGGVNRRPELLEPLFRQAHRRAGNGNTSNRPPYSLKMGAAMQHMPSVCSSSSIDQPRVRVAWNAPRALAGCRAVRCVKCSSVRPEERAISLSDQVDNMALPMPDGMDGPAPPKPEKGAHRRMAFDLR